MPKWMKDESKWAQAKTAALKTYKESDAAFWPVVTDIYKKMGGKIEHEAKATDVEELTEEIMQVGELAVCDDVTGEDALCRDSGSVLDKTKKWKQGEPTDLMWAPGGTTVVTCGSGGRRVRLWVTVDEAAAKDVQKTFALAVAKTPRRRPFGCVEHHEEERAFEPKRFVWKNDPEPAIYCTAEPTKLGETNVNGGIHTSFSPCFRHDAKRATAKCEDCESSGEKCECGGTLYFPDGVRGSQANPARIIGVSEKSVGSLTNWPAFKDILPVTATEPNAEASGTSEGAVKAAETRKSSGSSQAIKETMKANSASDKAFSSGLEADHTAAHYAHTSAASAHALAATKVKKEGHKDFHSGAVASHLHEADIHKESATALKKVGTETMKTTDQEHTEEEIATAAEVESARKSRADKAKDDAVESFQALNQARIEPKMAKDNIQRSIDAAESATVHAAAAKPEEKSAAHAWAGEAHDCAAKSCSMGGDWRKQSHHYEQASLHRGYAIAAKDDQHPSHSRAMNFKASEPAKLTLEDIYARVPKSKVPTLEEIYARRGVKSQATGSN